MGLDVTAYQRVVRLAVNADGEPVDAAGAVLESGYFAVAVHPSYPGRADGLEQGYHGYVDHKPVFSGTYRRYNLWREALAKLAGYPLEPCDSWISLGASRVANGWECHAASAWNGKVPPGSPFVELVHYSDCEGTIGPVVAAKLQRDFAAFDERAKSSMSDDFYKTYLNFMRGLELAADGGALDFA